MLTRQSSSWLTIRCWSHWLYHSLQYSWEQPAAHSRMENHVVGHYPVAATMLPASLSCIVQLFLVDLSLSSLVYGREAPALAQETASQQDSSNIFFTLYRSAIPVEGVPQSLVACVVCAYCDSLRILECPQAPVVGEETPRISFSFSSDTSCTPK